jgi:NAD(P)-dependent dehydrogenase (short-subunit alcohol dehydrogenase family)
LISNVSSPVVHQGGGSIINISSIAGSIGPGWGNGKAATVAFAAVSRF